MVLVTGDAALAPVSAVVRGLAALWAPPKPRVAWRRTTCLLSVKPEEEHVALRKDAAGWKGSAVTRVGGHLDR